MAHQVVSDYTKVSENANVKVFVRARPPEASDEPADELFERGEVEKGRVKKLTMKQWKRTGAEGDQHEQWGGVGGNAFQFDGVFWCEAVQEEVFKTVCKEQVDHILRGYNACCFAYGQTGSGKTHSMFFPKGGVDRSDADRQGLIPRAVDYLFSRLSQPGVEAEVNVRRCPARGVIHGPSTEKTSDIYQGAAKQRGETFGLGVRQQSGGLGLANSKSSLSINTAPPVLQKAGGDASDQGHWYELKEEIREDKDGVVFVKGLAKLAVKSSADVLNIIDRGLRLRATESTSMNDTSSRSHTVFTIEVSIAKGGRGGASGVMGKLHLVDLAGSERLKKSESSGIRMEEALHINKSLTALGKVIVSLDPTASNGHVPYRDSKLTRLLQNALGGDSYTSVLATIRPTRSHAEECLSTLQFANRCRKVANNPRVHRVGETEGQANKAKDEQIRALRAEIERLKEFTRKLKKTLAEATGRDVAEFGSSDLGGSKVESLLLGAALGGGGGRENPAQTQAAVTGAVMAALRAAGVAGATVDENTGGEGEQRRRSSVAAGKMRRGSTVVTGIASRVAKVFGYGSPQDVPQALINVLAEREDEFDALKRKFDAKKDEIDALHKEIELNERKDELLKAQAAEHATQVAALVKENEDIVSRLAKERSANPLGGLPGATVGPRAKMKLLTVKEMGRKVSAAAARAQRAEGRAAGSEGTIARLKEQYEYWLAKKDRDAAKFIAQLNVYRAKKRTQLETADLELVALWDAVDRHACSASRRASTAPPARQQRRRAGDPAGRPAAVDGGPGAGPAPGDAARREEAGPGPPRPRRARRATRTRSPTSTASRASPRAKSVRNAQQRSSDSLLSNRTPEPPRTTTGFSATLGRGPRRRRRRAAPATAFDYAGGAGGDADELRGELAAARAALRDLGRPSTRVKRVTSELGARDGPVRRDLEEAKRDADKRASDHARQYSQLRVAFEAQRRAGGTQGAPPAASPACGTGLRPGSASGLDRSGPARPASARAAHRPRM
ncbi:ATP-dependent microtubule motor [Aureococcus anophagefferens]|nr:ATP-dependent microtubule motor [Aureococcus anophagefferens]